MIKIKQKLQVWGRKMKEVKCHFHCFRVYTTNMTYQMYQHQCDVDHDYLAEIVFFQVLY